MTDRLSDQQQIIELVQERVDAEWDEYCRSSDEVSQADSQFTSEVILHALDSNEDGDSWLYRELYLTSLCYDHAAKRWYQWAGHYWQEDLIDQATANIQAVIEIYGEEAHRQALQRIQAEKNGQPDTGNQHKQKEDALLKRIRDLQTARRKASVLNLAKVGEDSLAITGKEWDSDPWLLGCENGVVDLRTGELRAGRPEDYIKTIAPIEWQGLNSSAPAWDSCLDQVFNGDSELTAYVQRLLGYGITGRATEHIHPILWGEGRNGKGTILETLKHVLGDLAHKAEAELLLEQRYANRSGAPRSDIMALRGKRLVWVSETGEGRRLNTSRLKELVGGDTLSGREPYGKRQVEFRPTHLLLMLTNHRPHAPATDYALWQRIHLIPFTERFVDNPKERNERHRNPDLLDKLKAEAAGILAWLVEGCLEWQRKGINPPETVKTATREYQQDEDLLRHFFDDCCSIEPEAKVQAGKLYEAYRAWTKNMGHHPMSGTRFGKNIGHQFGSYRGSKGKFYTGIMLLSDYEQAGE